MTMTAERAPSNDTKPIGITAKAAWPPLLGDLIGPIAVYYVAQALGARPLLAMILGGLTCLPRLAIQLARRRRLDGLGVAVLASFALGALLALTTGDVRMLAIKDAVWPLAGALVTAGSCVRGTRTSTRKPVTFYLFRPLLTQGRAENRPFWDQVWARGPAFRRCLRTLALAWSAILLAATAAEIVLAGTLPLTQAGAVPGIVTLATVPLLLGTTALYGKRTGLGIRAALSQADQ